MIKNEEYKFGDLTKGAVSSVRSSTEGILTYSEKTLSLLRGANIHEAVAGGRKHSFATKESKIEWGRNVIGLVRIMTMMN